MTLRCAAMIAAAIAGTRRRERTGTVPIFSAGKNGSEFR